MRNFRELLIICVVGLLLNLVTGVARAADEDAFLEQIRTPSEQGMGYGRSAIWTLPLVAAQYQPSQLTPEMQTALQAQQEGRFLDALIVLDDTRQSSKGNADNQAELSLLRASFLLQGSQSPQAIESLAYLLTNTRYAADAYALTAMGHMQLGKMREALDAAQHAQNSGGGILAHLALSYVLQGTGRLAEAGEVMHGFNTSSASAIALAREAELALTLGQIQSAKTLVDLAQAMDASHPYVIAVSGLVYLIDGHPQNAKSAFEIALKRDPKDAKTLLGLGLAEIKLGNFQAGQDHLLAANESAPRNALILTYLGRSQQQFGQTGAAMASWRSAQQADPKDPVPWLYQAQAELQANQPLQARESLNQAQVRLAYRSVYRGERLLNEDQQLLQANLSEVQRQLGMENLAFHTLSDTVGEKNSSNLRSQADVLQGQRFAESARRSLLLQSQFNDKPGNLPSELDIYGDGAGQSGASVPQHGVVSGLNAQQASYNNYDELFSRPMTVAADATAGNQGSKGEQIRAGAASDTLGVSAAPRRYKTDGSGVFNNLDNRIWQVAVQWRPLASTQLFVSRQSVNSQRGETTYPADSLWNGNYHQYEDSSSITRLGLRYSLTDSSELRGLVSQQRTEQTDNWEWMSDFFSPTDPYYTTPALNSTFGVRHNNSTARSAEFQYRRSGAGYATQWGVSQVRSPYNNPYSFIPPTITNFAQQIYADWQQALNQYWQLEAGLAWGRNDKEFAASTTHLRRWLPKLGMVYTPDDMTHLRLAAWKNLDDAAVGNASLASATLAGFVLNRPGDTYKLVQSVALGADRQLNPAWLLEGQAQKRWTDDPINGSSSMARRQFEEARLALHWQPINHPLHVTLAYDDEQFFQPEVSFLEPNSVLRQHLSSQQLVLRWLVGAQWTANLAMSHNQLTAKHQSNLLDSFFNSVPVLLDVEERFNQTDASLNWRFNRKSSVDVGVRNATNSSYQYTEMDSMIPRFSKGRLWYTKLKLAW